MNGCKTLEWKCLETCVSRHILCATAAYITDLSVPDEVRPRVLRSFARQAEGEIPVLHCVPLLEG
jgi:hypothetical protein